MNQKNQNINQELEGLQKKMRERTDELIAEKRSLIKTSFFTAESLS